MVYDERLMTKFLNKGKGVAFFFEVHYNTQKIKRRIFCVPTIIYHSMIQNQKVMRFLQA